MKTIAVQSAAVLILLTLCSVNTVLSITCYVCTYTGTGTDTTNCLSPTSSTPTVACNAASYAGCGYNLTSPAFGSSTASTASRFCAATATGSNCSSSSIPGVGMSKNCTCTTDRCNNGVADSNPGIQLDPPSMDEMATGTRKVSTVTPKNSGSILPQMSYAASLMLMGALVITGRLLM